MALRQWLATWAAQANTAQKLGPAGAVVQRQALRDSLRHRLQQNPGLRLETLAEVETAAALGISIDANCASVDDWLRLPGLSIHQARSLTQLSQSGVQFHCIEDVAAALSLSPASIARLEPILQFCFYDSEALIGEAIALNPNQATLEALLQLPTMTRPMAQTIIYQRQQHPFEHLVDFQTRLQLPAAAVEKLMHYLQF